MARSMTLVGATLLVVAGAGWAASQDNAAASAAPTAAIKRIPLQRFDVPGTSYETVIGIAEIAPNVPIGRHIHPGPESGYVIEGGFDLLVDGEAPRRIGKGDSYVVSARVAHDALSGPDGAKVIATYVIEKGQPLAAPAP